jgi:acyl-CoA synthetase (AMP-forming)/AMP-acid ligase II
LIIVNGKNIYPSDIEIRIEEILTNVVRPGCSAAFQIDDDAAAIICEFKADIKDSVTDQVLRDITAQLETEFGLRISGLLICRKGSVPRTTSGKIQRSKSRVMFLDGLFKPDKSLQKAKKTESFEALLKCFGVTDMNKSLSENGVDSMNLTNLVYQSKGILD